MTKKGPWLCPLCQCSLQYDSMHEEVFCTDKQCMYFTSLKDYENNFYRLSMSHERTVKQALEAVEQYEEKFNNLDWTVEDLSRDIRNQEVQDNILRTMIFDLQKRCNELEKFKEQVEARRKMCGFELEPDDADIQT